MNTSIEYETESFAAEKTENYRIFFKKILPSVDSTTAKIFISPLHDIPLYSEHGYNWYRMIVEMPRWTNTRLKISKTEPLNPIGQEIKNDKLDFVKNVFPFHGVLWNYGILPQTWEMPNYENPKIHNGLRGDNDPLDAIEIGSRVYPPGSVLDVKVLGAIALIENDLLDWKIITINVNDELAVRLNEIEDLFNYLPGLIDTTIEWFKYYKVPSGGPFVELAFSNKIFDRHTAYETIETSHKLWKNILKNELFLKQTKDCADFKLINTQCVWCNNQNLKNDKEAESIVENLKELLATKPLDTLLDPPSSYELDYVYYLSKLDSNSKHAAKKILKIDDSFFDDSNHTSDRNHLQREKKPIRTDYMKNILKRFILPLSATSIIGYLIYLRYKDSRI